jgi:hypothetical protein
MLTKTCTVCQEPLPIAAFHKCALGLYGVRADCKSCRAKSYKQNAEPAKEAAKAYYATHRDQRRAYFKSRKAAKALK